jgi:hypothetical protein
MSAQVPKAAWVEEQKEMEVEMTSPEKAEKAKLKAIILSSPGTKAWWLRFFKERTKIF